MFHKLRSANLETFNELFKGIFDVHGSVPTKGLRATRRFALGALFVYQLTLLARSDARLPSAPASKLSSKPPDNYVQASASSSR